MVVRPLGDMAALERPSSFASLLTAKMPCGVTVLPETTNRSARISRLVGLKVWV
jgi:hypothetical protein